MKPSGFSASKCMQNILWRRTMFAVTLEQQKSLQSILSHRRANGCQFIIGYSSTGAQEHACVPYFETVLKAEYGER